MIRSSSASDRVERGRNPEYQRSNGSSGRPSFAEITFASAGSSGAASTSSSIATTFSSGISRWRSNVRAMWVGAEGE